MENNIFYNWLTINIISHIFRLFYEIRKAKNKVKFTTLNFIIVFTAMFMLWSSWFGMCESDIIKIQLPDVVKYIGLSLVIIGVFIFFISLFTIKTLENFEGGLITKGIYSFIRHPMYFSFILWIIGFSVFQGALISFCISPVLIWNILFWRKNEEKLLALKYPGYIDYRKKTFF